MVASSECDKMSIVSRCWVGDTPRAANIGMTQLISETLEVIGSETIVVPKYVVMRWSTGTLVKKGEKPLLSVSLSLPALQHENKERSQIQLDELYQHQLWYQLVCSRSFQPTHTHKEPCAYTQYIIILYRYLITIIRAE